MRGKLLRQCLLEMSERITPACAGKRACWRRRRCPASDHPRVCGEKDPPDGVLAPYPGLPPRMRGKDPRDGQGRFFGRITPACAGKSLQVRSKARGLQDHPRMCGEKLDVNTFSLLKVGSPPRMRGKVPVVDRAFRATGITPAYAGKSLYCQSVDLARMHHPRVCGEKSLAALAYWFRLGSPPHMRGKVEKRELPGFGFGITPAYAGKRKP